MRQAWRDYSTPPRGDGPPARLLAALALAVALLSGPAAAQQDPEPAPPVLADPGAMLSPAPAAPAPTIAPDAAAPAPPAAPMELAAGPAEQPAAAADAAGLLPQDLTAWGMFEAADHVVKAVMIGLAFASLVTWTIALAKSLELAAAGARLRRGLRVVLDAADLDQAERALAGRRGPMVAMVRAARLEADTAPAMLQQGEGLGFLQRVSSHVGRVEVQATRRLNAGVGILGTIGATAPFVGLFGTVWGIMNSFIGISEAQTTNLAIVAPGIAEALLATALGLVAAIPAVMLYNLFARWIAAYRARLGDAAAALERLVSRDLDHRRLVPVRLAQAAE